MRTLTLLLLAVALAAGRAGAEPRIITFAQAIDLAAEKNPQVRLAKAAVGAAEAKLRATRALRYPSLAADGSVQVWDKALELELGGLMLPPGTDSVIRDRVTSTVSVTLTQPLTGLLLLGYLVGVDQHGAEAVRADGDAGRLDAAERAAEGFLRALQARAGLEISLKSLEQIEAQLARARVLEQGGVMGRIDVLRLESARDGARQVVLRQRTGAVTATRALALALGLPPDEPLDVRDDLPDPPPQATMTEDQAVAAAARVRPELRAAAQRIDQAESARKVAMADYFPDIRATANYTHADGNSTFQPRDSWYVGLALHWTLWDWGNTRAGVQEAAARKEQAMIAAASLGDQVSFETRRLALEAATAHETLEVSASALRAAEEAYRIQSVRYQQGAATTTDVLESETEVARARISAAVARYDVFLSLAALARATGELPRF